MHNFFNIDTERKIFQEDRMYLSLFVLLIIPLTLMLKKVTSGYEYRKKKTAKGQLSIIYG